MSNNKLGGAPSRSQEAIGKLSQNVTPKNDDQWAATINLLVTLDPKVARKRLMRA